MKKTFIINGGAGRVIAAIPALEKYAKLNPKKDFNVIVHGWEYLFWSHPLLQKRTYGIHTKGLFDNVIKKTDTICPEPYYIHDFYNQKITLAEAFDRIINETDDHSDLDKPNLYISSLERNSAQFIINQAKEQKKKGLSVVIQPYGSGMRVMHNRPHDTTQRSLDVDQYLEIVKKLSEHAVVYYFGPPDLRHPADTFTETLQGFNPDLRMFMSLIAQSDYFVGCDSVGQHMARAFNKPGTIFMGSTFDTNFSYPNHFDIVRKKGQKPDYNPIRFGGLDPELADRSNDDILVFDQDQLTQVINDICTNLYTVK